MKAVCWALGMSRQNYYAGRKRRQRRQVEAELVVELVRSERRLQPRLGTRKLRVLLQGPLAQAGVRLGRDRFFEVLRGQGLLLAPRRSQNPCTTDSYHNLPVFRNLIKGHTFTQPNQVWVSDLTYLRSDEGFMYLSLLTDKVSRYIVGYHCADTLEVTGSLAALEMALQQMPAGAKPIHHSDRGSQYCSHQYVNRSVDAGLTMSMTETDHCAENALAERVNGILKNEYGLDQQFKTKEQVKHAAAQAIHFYRTRRPHTALGNRFPAQVHGFWPPPAPPRDARRLGPSALRHEPRTKVRRPAHVGAIPVADHPVQRFAKVTN